jgi:diguanylate cyclase (GGDEF)-like protein
MRLVPVELSGVVTGMPGYRNSFFFQDGTAGISVDRTDQAEVVTGDRVQVTGTSGPGLFAPVVLASQVRVLGRGPPPPAPRMTLGDLFGGLEDSQWIELRGVVRTASKAKLFGRTTWLLVLQLDGGSVNLQLQDIAGFDGTQLIDSVIRVRGVCASSGNKNRQFVGSTLLVPHRYDLTVEQPAPPNPFTAPAHPVADVLKLGQWQHRVKVAGVVTYQIPGQAIYLQEGNNGILVQTLSTEIAPPGSRIEAVGFPAMREYAPVLEDGLFRIVGRGNPLPPERIEARDIITSKDGTSSGGNYDQQLVQLNAILIEVHVQGDQKVWIMRQNGDEFEARIPLSALSAPPQPIPDGSLLSLTGICVIHVGATLNPVSYTLLLRSPEDIVVLKRGPWWTADRALIVLSGVAGLTLLILLWVALLRIRVEQQTRTIRESGEKFRYLSEHDELTGLLNRRAILLALDQQLVRGCREHKTVTVVLGDIDHFKLVNDIHGHLAGDAALRRFAEAVTGCIRPYDSAGRYGGEEFLLILSGIPEQDIEDRLKTLHGTLSNLTVSYLKTEFRISCSLGAVVAAGCQTGVEQDSLLVAADRALYQAKAAGRNRVVVQLQRV